MNTDVMIVGYGPVGKLLAIQVGRRGHSVVVIDRNDADYPLPRAVTHCSDFARIIQSVGLAPDTIPEITEPYDDLYYWHDNQGRTLVEVDWSGVGESGWYNVYFFHQPELERRLDELVDRLPSITVLRGWEAISLSQSTDTATVAARSMRTGGEMTVTAAWVVGADGANSKVREWAGLPWHNEGYFFDWLVVDVKPLSGVEFPHVAKQNCDFRRPTTMVPGGPGRRRWEFMRLPHEAKETLNRTEKAWELLGDFGLTPQNSKLERHTVYTFQACWATRWREGRVILAGDAAHLMPPFAGQGLGAGVRDVMNLSWKLDAVLRGIASEQLIDTYEAERMHHAVAFVRFSTELGKVVCITDPTRAAERDDRMIADWGAAMRATTPPRPGLGPGVHAGSYGGHLARQGRVRVPDGSLRWFDDAFGGPGALIARSAASLIGLDKQIRSSLAALDIDLVALSGSATANVTVVEDADGTYGAWLDELHADLVLVRPDFHLYGSGSHDDAAKLATGFLGHFGAQTS
ncbi:MAG: bifunctional 3-(3-hydroxy-phenyl)propionate/3-hydroxycinnamic acid hydroxylase [Mycolicibacterium sp.]|uniref:bifunctional 3-(3-hydroxy-phenyl)propionate/3-hydroxycinnamic acid hydroxylase MhpA n=1 Tax=Mycolicibacterium sp. TaxID=2320850 RepID=UPI003D142743